MSGLLPGGLLAGGRGLLVLDRTCHGAPGRRRAATATADAALHTLVLATPGLERLVSGVLLDADCFDRTRGGGRGPRGGGGRSVPVGVFISDDAIPEGQREPTVFLSRRLVARAEEGAAFAGWSLTMAAADAAEERSARVRLAACWAVACRDTGVPGVLSCTIDVPPRAPLGEAELRHRAAAGELLDELHARRVELDSIWLSVNLVLPGRRGNGAVTTEDVAHATIRSLRGAGLDDHAGVAVQVPRRVADLAGYLAALQWHEHRWRWGFAAGANLLAPVAESWAGRSDRVHAAQHELHARLGGLVSVLRASAGAG